MSSVFFYVCQVLNNNFKNMKGSIKAIADGVLNGSTYASNKRAISQLFGVTSEEKEEDILLRLTVIDSMYSTQMNKRYYALEDLAKAMFTLKTEKGCSLAKLFTDFANAPKASKVDYSGGNLFGNSYGIGKDGEEKGIAISLISKYAYFTTDYQFPIFDSIVCDMLPRLSAYNGFSKPEIKGTNGADKMVSFVSEINSFISQCGGVGFKVSYDSLDRLLWVLGKIERENLSLVLSKAEYLSYVSSKGTLPSRFDPLVDLLKRLPK